MNERFNKLVSKNNMTGSPRVQSFKAIIKQGLYPDGDMEFSFGSMKCSSRALETFENENPSSEELIDVMLFYVECGSQLISDYDGMGEEFHDELEPVLERVIILIKKHNLLTKSQNRLEMIMRECRDTGYGYGDHVADLLDTHFPGIFKFSTY